MKVVTKLCKLSAEIMSEVAKISEDLEEDDLEDGVMMCLENKFRLIKLYIGDFKGMEHDSSRIESNSFLGERSDKE